MNAPNYRRAEAGFSMLELLIGVGLMLILMGVVFTFARDSIKSSLVTMELTEAQESVRAAHEFITRDLITAGDGLNGINNIRLPLNFVTNYLTTAPVTDPSTPTSVNAAIVTSDNNVPANTVILGTNPLVNVRTGTDRLTILRTDSSLPMISLLANAFSANGSTFTSAAAATNFNVNDVLFVSSTNGATFCTVTGKAGNTLNLAAGDTLGLNQPFNGGLINVVTSNGTLPTSLTRMQIIQYFVDANGLLIRRVFGTGGGVAYRDSVVAEHVTNLQFRYELNLLNANGTIQQPVTQITNAQQQVAVRQVEVTIGVETTHPVSKMNANNNGGRETVSMTTSTSVRNMQFRQALMPGSGS
jgi:type II secretory pathway pseudopilin PulG